MPDTLVTATEGVDFASELTTLGDFSRSIALVETVVTADGTLVTSTPVPDKGVLVKTLMVPRSTTGGAPPPPAAEAIPPAQMTPPAAHAAKTLRIPPPRRPTTSRFLHKDAPRATWQLQAF